MDLRALSVGQAAIIFPIVLVGWRFSDTLSPVGAAEGCDLLILILILIFRLRLNSLGQDRSLVALDSSYSSYGFCGNNFPPLPLLALGRNPQHFLDRGQARRDLLRP